MNNRSMLLQRLRAFLAVGVLLGGLGASVPGASADRKASETEIWAIAQGGLFYDKWWAVLFHEPPKSTHPAYPAAGKKKGSSTWRCKECHGWDYKGVDGAYGTGSHFTGIRGIRSKVGADPDEIAKIIRDDTHAYTPEMIPDMAVARIAAFVSLGQIDMDQYIVRETKRARGDADNGARFYQTICAVCHGFDGKTINFKDEHKPEYIGTVAKRNPWETLHKIRNGHPGVGMVALIALDIQDQADILAFVQTLPEK